VDRHLVNSFLVFFGAPQALTCPPAGLHLTHDVAVQGMLRSVVVGQFFHDLKNPAYTTAFAVYHRRFSTNTTPKWPLAQPMRVLGHNGVPLCGTSGVPTRRQQRVEWGRLT